MKRISQHFRWVYQGHTEFETVTLLCSECEMGFDLELEELEAVTTDGCFTCTCGNDIEVRDLIKCYALEQGT